MTRETITYDQIPRGQCFTFDDAMYVYFEDTQKGEARSFHAYKDGYLYSSSIKVHHRKEFYLCDVNGRYIPYSLVMENIALKAKVKELKRQEGYEPKYIGTIKAIEL